MTNLLLDIEQYIISKGLATADGVDLFRDFSPPSPDGVIILTEYTGSQDRASLVCNRSVQVMVRSVDYDEARSKAWSLYNLFDVPEDRILNLTAERWAVVTAKQPPFRVGTDENGRVLFVFNLSVVTYRD